MNLDFMTAGSERHLDRHPHRARFRRDSTVDADRSKRRDFIEAEDAVDGRIERGRERRIELVTERDRSRRPTLDGCAHYASARSRPSIVASHVPRHLCNCRRGIEGSAPSEPERQDLAPIDDRIERMSRLFVEQPGR